MRSAKKSVLVGTKERIPNGGHFFRPNSAGAKTHISPLLSRKKDTGNSAAAALFFAKKGTRHLPYLGTATNDLGVSLSSSSRIFKEKGVVVVALIYWRGSSLFGRKKKESNELIKSRPFPPAKI